MRQPTDLGARSAATFALEGHVMLRVVRPLGLTVVFLLLLAKLTSAQTDEIQVYDASIAARGVFNLTLHDNFTPVGTQLPAFAGALIADKSFNGVPEWAYGVTDWFEAGLYFPLYSIGKTSGHDTAAMFNGAKIRTLFVAPHADDRKFFYGVNFEFSVNAKHWDTSRFTSEVRPILGWHLDPIDIVVNPILDTAYDGAGNLDFAPATRVAYNWSKRWAVAVEEYDDFGPVHHFHPLDAESHELWGVVDRRIGQISVEVGAGVGLTSASDRFTLKLILSRDLNQRSVVSAPRP
jgi:hypothetical protein